MNSMIDLRSCHKNYFFQPETPWSPLLPAYCYENELLCAFDRQEGFAVSLEGGGLALAFKAIYPELSLVELCRLSAKLPQNTLLLKEVWELYGYRWRESLKEVIERVIELPQPVQSVLYEKKMSLQDLAPLRSLSSVKELEFLWPFWTQSQLSKSDLAKSLEWLVELVLLGTPVDQLQPTSASASWLKELAMKRFPQTTKQDQMAEVRMRLLPWPPKSEARWTRRGDLAGIEVKLFLTHPNDLLKNVEKLQDVYREITEKKGFEALWSPN